MRHGIKIHHPLKILTNDELYRIHISSLEVLERAGILICHNGVLKKLEDTGAEVDHKKLIARIPEHLVKEMLKKVPSKVTLCGRNPKHNVFLERGRAYATTTGGAVYVVGQDGVHRKANTEDVANLTRLADGLDNIDFNEGLVDPQEIPHKIRDVHSSSIILKNTEKHCRYAVMSPEGAKAFIRMAAIIVGDENKLRKKPIISGAGYVSPPLRYDKYIGIDIFLEFVKHGLPTYVGSEPISGGIAPVTLAGTLVQNNAEALAGIVVAEIINSGNPVIYGGNCNSLDMRTGSAVQASPENALMGVAVVQLAQYYGLPSWLYTGMTNSKIPDQQVGYEKAATALLPLLAGPNIHFAAGNLSSALATSYEQLVIDDEVLAMLQRIAEGIEINDTTLAVDVICKVGPSGHYLAEKHTLEHFKQEHWMPKISERRSIEEWRKDGAKNIVQRAKETAENILKTHYPEKLPKDVEKEIDEIVGALKRNQRFGSSG